MFGSRSAGCYESEIARLGNEIKDLKEESTYEKIAEGED